MRLGNGEFVTTAQRPPPLIALALAAAAGLVAVASNHGWRLGAAAALGLAIGATLLLSRFSFAGAYRQLIVRGDTDGVRAQIVLIALTAVIFAPILAYAPAGSGDVAEALAPVGLQGVLGAFAFGIGMQLAGGCASGTLFAIGGGGLPMIAALIAFCLGGFWATLNFDFWSALPEGMEVSIGHQFGWPMATALQGAALFGLWLLLSPSGVRTVSTPAAAAPLFSTSGNRWSKLHWGALALAVLNAATLVAVAHPWSITWGFTLWGAKAARLVGWIPESSSFWSTPERLEALSAGFFADSVSTMNVGIIAGAAAAALLGGSWRLARSTSPRALVGTILGGLLMGYGARLSYGCNIGAMVSGIASGSLHGWAWPAFALPGCWVGIRLRPLFGLGN